MSRSVIHFRFRLRTFFLAVTLLCFWLGIRTSCLRQEDRAIGNIQAVGGQVYFGKPFHPQYGHAYTSHDRSLSFVHRFFLGNGTQNVCTVRFLPSGRSIGDHEIESLLPSLAKFRDLRELRLHDSGISNKTIDAIRTLRSLEVLDLCMTNIDDGAIDALKELPNLRYLDIYGTNVSIAGTSDLQSASPNCLIRGPKKGVGYFGHEHYADASKK